MSADLLNPGTIYVLSEEVASKIAAGEVVERPASVVRELLDNAIDAGARHVRVEVRGGGRELIRIIDDGCGVRKEDMSKAFLRHATSKIRTAEDLWTVRTLGFRGEALFSIAAVSRIAFLSRLQGSQTGYEQLLEAGQVVSEGMRGAPHGTSVAVRDLFFNLPARLKFLKSPQAEAAHITALIQQYALSHPHIQFTLTNEGRQSFQSLGNSDLRSAAICVYGPEVGRLMLPVGLEPDELGGGAETGLGIAINGYTSPPVVSRSNRQAMHFFINRRAVQSRMLQFAVEEAYHSLLMVGRRPVSIINVLIDPSLLDVNVHPAKAEVKFRDDRAVFSSVQRAVRSALQAHLPAPSYGSRGPEGWMLPDTASPGAAPEMELGNGQGPSATTSPVTQREMWDGAPATEAGGSEPLPLPQPRNLPPLRVVGQVGGTYIIAEGPDGLFLVDQHAAHERILYERLGAALEAGSLPVQPLLEPVSLEFSTRHREEIEAIMPLMSDLGFEIELFGESALLVRAVPAIYAARRDLGRDLLEVLDTVLTGSHPARWREEMAITLACHSAIRAGQSLSLDEMRAMMVQLELCRYPRSCAHGRPTMLHLSQLQLEREFGRRA